MTIASAALLLFLILDPLGNIPVFLSLLRGMPAHRQRFVLVREMLIALAVLMVFLHFGRYALDLMHLRQESVSIAGGIVLFLIGLRMIFPPPEGLLGELPGGEPFIVPMAIPLVAGPSGMAAVMLMGSQEPERMGAWSLALAIAWFAPSMLWMYDLTAPGYPVAVVVFGAYVGVAGILVPGRAERPWVRWLAVPSAFTLAEAARWTFPFGGVPLATTAMSQALKAGIEVVLRWTLTVTDAQFSADGGKHVDTTEEVVYVAA